MSASRTLCLIALITLFGFLAPPQTALAAEETVQLQVLTIRATKSNNEISPQLKPLAEALKKSFKFTGYKLLKTDSRKAAFNRTLAISLAGPYKARIRPLARKDNRIQLKVEVFERKNNKDIGKLSTTISLAAGKSQLFGGWKLDGQDVLIIAVSAK
jgi:hypothetical protein